MSDLVDHDLTAKPIEMSDQSMGSSRHQSSARGDASAANAALPGSLVAHQRGPIALLRLSRPAKSNAIDKEIIDGIRLFFSAPPKWARAVVLHGEGRHFSGECYKLQSPIAVFA
jgi:hypothetical protein